MRFFLSALLAVAAVVTAPAQAQRDNNCSGEGQRPCRRGPGCDAGLEVVDDRCVEVSDSGDGDDPPICGFLDAVPCPDGCDAGLEEVGGLCVEVSDSGDGDDPPICGSLGDVACPVPGLFSNGCDGLNLSPDIEGLCSFCGKNGEPPCEEDGCGGGLPGFVDLDGICANCGGFGEPACIVDDVNESACEAELTEANGICDGAFV